MRRILILIELALAIAMAFTLPARAAHPTKKFVAQTHTQLPRTARPQHYDVTIEPDLAAMRFSGKADIAIEILQPTATVTLNAVDMNFSNATLASGKTSRPATKIEIDEKTQTASFGFDQRLAKGSYRLKLDYSGKINTQATGLFAIDYPTPDGKKRALYTQFESADARRMVPSWDEPAFKASFTLTALVPRHLMAVSNMPAAERRPHGEGRELVRFAPTPKMSSYLLFFGLGEFERATAEQDGVELGVVTKKGSVAQATFVLESSKAVVKELNEYFGVKYPLPKLDNVAAPGGSQSFGAMENWGAILSFEHAILHDPTISSQLDKQRAFSTATHEIAHQWFGNLVTMRWWDDLWLNEGFASWITDRTTQKLHPEWQTALSAVTRREWALEQDALETTQPVVRPVETVEQMRPDAITYQKGAAVIGMVEDYVGRAAWRSGVSRYMKKHAYGNATSDDLWTQIEAAAKIPVKAIAHDFTMQPGVPLIRVDLSACRKGHTTMRLVQGEFSRDHPEKKPLQWRVPVILQPLGSESTYRVLVRSGAATINLPGCAPVVVNAGQSGYFRTLYPAEHFAPLAANFNQLSPVDQLGLLSDSWSLGMSGLQSPAYFLDLTKATPLSADPKVWGRIAGVLGLLDRSYAADPVRRAAFRRFAIARLTPKLAQVGWSAQAGEPAPLAILRNELIENLGILGDAAVISEARRRYAARASDPTALPGALRRTVLSVVAAHADTVTWDQLHAAALAEKVPLVRDQLFQLLAAAEDPELVRKGLSIALTSEPGETAGAAMIRRAAAFHPDLAVDFALANLTLVNTKLDAEARSRYIPALARGSLDPAMIAKLNDFAAQHLPPTARREVRAAIANINYRIKATRERLPLIDAWLSRNSD